ncbi:MAG: hypothetical protein LC790_11415 [Actinobacteria bacterium]|nr:hypothetical protein [Actinomycetota bacterium]
MTPSLPATRCSSTSPWPSWVARHPTLAVATAIAVVTIATATAATVTPELGPAVAPHPTLHGTPDEVVSIVVQNLRTLIAPLLLIAGRWHTARVTRHVGDLLVATLVIANATLVGLALGRYPTQLPAYLPHLPLEDAALAIAAGAWLARRVAAQAGSRAPSLGRTALLTVVVTIVAAIVETYAVPHGG